MKKIKKLKVLIIRFGAIGDILMTTPVIRCVKQQLAAELHYITARKYKLLLEHNVHIDRIHCFEDDWRELKGELSAEKFDLIIDLHKVPKSLRLGAYLKGPIIHYHKATTEKWLMLALGVNRLPSGHLIDRFFKALAPIKVTNDGKGMELFIDPLTEENTTNYLDSLALSETFTVLVIGAAKQTKQISMELCVEYVNHTDEPIVLLGGPDDIKKALRIVQRSSRDVFNLVGKLDLLASAVVLRESSLVITGDTGMMHMASIYSKPTIVIYGSTSPVFGMYPYAIHAGQNVEYLLPDHLACWPCSKSGRDLCPKGHDKCQKDWRAFDIKTATNKLAIRN